MALTTQLLELPLWAAEAYAESGTPAQRIGTSYERAQSLAKHIGMTVKDITQLTDKFWDFHTDYVVTRDTAVTTILTIHWNLCMGTIASYAENRPELHNVLAELERFESVGEFMLTEVGHGLDARNIETTATRNQDGSFVLHTPNTAAAKIMPPTTPHARMPRLAVVFAQLIVDEERRGVRPFIVRINDAKVMAPGVTSRLLPARPGAKMLDHAVTTFDNVRLDSWALLGEVETPDNLRKDFFRHIHRVTVGTLSLSLCNIPVGRLCGYILGRYSQKRRIAGAGATPDERVPIITFATQHTPILTMLATDNILEAFSKEIIQTFIETKEPQMRSALATIFKQTATYSTQSLCNEMIDRCGWQGLYTHNQMMELISSLRGNSIAEGDSLVLCIRLVSELFLGRYEIPKAKNPTSLLAEHEMGVWTEAAEMAMSIMTTTGSNRNDEFNAFLLPRVRKLVQATGHRMAYEAASTSDKVTPEMLRLYETTCILEDPSWYVENKSMKSGDLYKLHAEAVRALLPSLDKMLEDSAAAPWATAPILDEGRWLEFIDRLPAFSSSSSSSNSGSDADSVTTKQGTQISHSKDSKDVEPKVQERLSDESVAEKKSLGKKLKSRKDKPCVIL
ncbi:Peroxisomal acyl-coenzyme A oxidase 3-like protein [Cladobotryum mycophilum]|uniref:Peroxisomal acyl-coenzyme A oxidase 3-like protein n=1 Tax=Cladobotryum mycophilum TaxID=491253 RepID=A0ABR0SQ85_9HYPO